MSEPVVSRLFIYPVKSARGIEVVEAALDPCGFHLDRRWMVVDEEGTFVTQREHPALCRIQVVVEQNELILVAPGMPALELPLHPDPGPEVRVRIWGDTVSTVSMGPGPAHWLERYLRTPSRLVFRPRESARRVEEGRGDVGLQDSFPLHLLSEASVQALNRRLEEPVSVVRFRPNLVVRGVEPHAEDGWKRLRIGEVELEVARPCPRCSIPTVDPETGEKGTEPIRTLATYRERDGKVYFGQNLVHRSLGTIAVGQQVRVLERAS